MQRLHWEMERSTEGVGRIHLSILIYLPIEGNVVIFLYLQWYFVVKRHCFLVNPLDHYLGSQ